MGARVYHLSSARVNPNASAYKRNDSMKFSIATKIFLAFTATIVVFGTVLVFGVWRTQKTLERVQAVNQTIVPLSLSLSDIQTDLRSFSLILNERDPLVLRRTIQVTRLAPSVPDRFERRIRQSVELSASPLLAPAVDAEFSDRVQDLESAIKTFSQDSKSLTQLVLDDRREDDARIVEAQTKLRDHVRRIDSELTALRAELRRATDKNIKEANQFERSSLYILAVSTGVALFVALVLLFAVSMTMRRLTHLTAAAKRIGAGDYSPLQAANKAPSDEIGTLFREFDQMARSIAERDQQLREQHARFVKTERLATIGRMTSLITHELRNPLSSINLNAEMVYDSMSHESSDPEVMEHLNTIIHEVDRLKDITEQYLVYARLPAPKFEAFMLRELVENLIDFHTWEWQDLGAEVQVEGEDPQIFADAGQIRQALLNIIKNAVEAGDSDQTILVRIEDDDNHVTLSIEDHSGGLPDVDLEKIFEPFYTTKQSGTGLGLAMTQQIIDEHGGKLRVEATENGTRFIIELKKENS